MSWKHVETGSDKRHTDISPNIIELGYHNLNKGISPTTKGDPVKTGNSGTKREICQQQWTIKHGSFSGPGLMSVDGERCRDQRTILQGGAPVR